MSGREDYRGYRNVNQEITSVRGKGHRSFTSFCTLREGDLKSNKHIQRKSSKNWGESNFPTILSAL